MLGKSGPTNTLPLLGMCWAQRRSTPSLKLSAVCLGFFTSASSLNFQGGGGEREDCCFNESQNFQYQGTHKSGQILGPFLVNLYIHFDINFFKLLSIFEPQVMLQYKICN